MSDELSALREKLAAEVVAATQVRSGLVAEALRSVPRHLFLPDEPPESAYRDDAIVTKRDEAGMPISSSSQPAIMAIMLDQLGLSPGQRVLEIGAGTGYNAALMRHIVGPSGLVVTVDIDTDLVTGARSHLAAAGYQDVTVVQADGAHGWPEHAPYDRVIATVGVTDLAPAWLDQTGPDGLVLVPLDLGGAQASVLFERAEGRPGIWASRSVRPCGFMPMRGTLAGQEYRASPWPGVIIKLPGRRDVGPTLDLAGPLVEVATGVRVQREDVYLSLGIWLGMREPRWCLVTQTLPPDGSGHGEAGLDEADPGIRALAGVPVTSSGTRISLGLVDDSGFAVLVYAPEPEPDSGDRLTPELAARGFGLGGAELAEELAGQVRAWHAAGRRGIATRLHVHAHTGSTRDNAAESGTMVIERQHTSFVLADRPGMP